MTRTTPRWWRDASAVACWASGLVVVRLWLAGGGAQGLTASPGLQLTSLRRIRIGAVPMSKLPAGQWRYLEPGERF